MILADKIIEERKRNGWSQEELAEKLEVSRQSVSKWEGAQSIPDINRIIQMAEIFGLSTDYLLKDDAVRNDKNDAPTELVDSVKKIRKVSMEDAADFLRIQEKNAPKVAFGVSICIASSILLIVLAGLADSGLFGISENLAGGLGVIVLLIMVAIGVYILIKSDAETKKYDFLNKVEIDTAYGVEGLAREKRTEYESKYTRNIILGVILCILSCVPLLISAFVTEKGYIIIFMVGLLLLIISIAVNLLIKTCTIKESYDKLLQEGDFTVRKKKTSTVLSRVSTIYWLTAVAIYFAWSLPKENWKVTWVVWPVGALFYIVIIEIVKIIIKAED